MKNFLLLFAILQTFLFASAQTDVANQAYLRHDYAAAVSLYEHKLTTLKSPELYYNLANAYYRQKNYGAAILNYERALRLAPHNEAIRENRDYCITKLHYTIPQKPRNFILQGFDNLSYTFSPNTWAIIGILFLILSLIGVGIYSFHPIASVKKWAFFLSLLGMPICLLANYYAWHFQNMLKTDNRAVVMSATILRASPSDNGDSISIANEGMLLEIADSLQGFYYLQLPNKTYAWANSEALEKL